MADKSKTKRERGSNFSYDEINNLVSIISENKDIIECKKTDAATWQMKDKVWDIVTDSFNSCSATIRSKKALRTKYEDIKKRIRKKCAHNKMELFKTGGGVPEMQKLTATEEAIAEIMGSTIDGQPSIWDSDSIPKTRNISSIDDDDMNDIDNDQEMQEDLAQSDAFENTEYLEDYENSEATLATHEKNVDKKIAEKGVNLLRKPMAPELKSTLKKKKSRKISQDNSDADKKEELHEMRMAVLRKELQINESRLLAAELDVEIKRVQKDVEEMRLRNLLQ